MVTFFVTGEIADKINNINATHHKIMAADYSVNVSVAGDPGIILAGWVMASFRHINIKDYFLVEQVLLDDQMTVGGPQRESLPLTQDTHFTQDKKDSFVCPMSMSPTGHTMTSRRKCLC